MEMKRGFRPTAILILFVLLGMISGFCYFLVIVPESERIYLSRLLSGSRDEIVPLVGFLFFILIGTANGLVLGYYIVPEHLYFGSGSYDKYHATIKTIAILLLLTLLGIAVGKVVGYLLVPGSFDLGGPFFGSRSGFGPIVGCYCSPFCGSVGLLIGAVWLALRRNKTKSTPSL